MATPPASPWSHAARRMRQRVDAAMDHMADIIKDATGSWHMVFLVTMLMNFAVVGLALFVLRPLRRRTMEASH